MSKNELTIGLPIYKGTKHDGRYLRRCLDSLKKQTYENFVAIIVDNGPDDEAAHIVNEYVQADSRFIYKRNPGNFEWSYSILRLITGCETPFFSILHFDSYWAPEYAEACLAALRQDNEAVLAYSQSQFISPEGELLEITRDIMSYDGADPVKRYLDVLGSLGWCTAFHGIARHHQVAKLLTPRVWHNMAALDNDYLAAMALEGKLVQIEQPLFFRTKEAYQAGESMVDRFDRLYRGIAFPFCRWVLALCRHVLHSSHSLETKNILINQTVSIMTTRYKHSFIFELNRIIDFVKNGTFSRNDYGTAQEQGLADVSRPGAYRFVDFGYLTELSMELDFAYNLLPKFKGLHLARALVQLGLGHQAEALLALDRELELDPTNNQCLELKARLASPVIN